MLTDKSRLILGAVIWVGVSVFLRPSLMEPVWAVILLLLAVLLMVPLASPFTLEGVRNNRVGILGFPAAVAFTIAFVLPAGLPAALLGLPWLGYTAVLAFLGLLRLKNRGLRPLSALAIDAGLIYLVVGGIWALLARIGIRPLGFSDAIVMLTAVHFHYAGFGLPVLCGLAAEKNPGRMANAAVLGVVAGVPFTAVGITLAQMGLGYAVETASALITATAGLLTAVLYFRQASDGSFQRSVRVFWAITAVSLTIGMFLAAAYGSRHIIALDWLTIPWMRAIHGTVNSIGFALGGLMGWRLHEGKVRNLRI